MRLDAVIVVVRFMPYTSRHYYKTTHSFLLLMITHSRYNLDAKIILIFRRSEMSFLSFKTLIKRAGEACM